MVRRYFFIIVVTVLYSFPYVALAEDLKGYEHAVMRSVPEITLQSTSDIHTLKDYQGKVLLLNFWATWCKLCLEEMPALERLQKRLDKNKILVLPISVDRKGLGASAGFLQRIGIFELPTLLDSDYKALSKFRLKALPTSIIVDKQFREIARIEGVIEWDSQAVEDYLNALAN
jgi:thiol-disulfide isomerase/thioredoxin